MNGASNARAIELLSGMLARRTGFALDQKRGPSVETALRRAMHRAGISEVSRFLSLLGTEQLPLDDLVAEIVVGETYFMREPDQWKLVRETILPGVVERHGRSHIVRCWSAGCATGEEAYSLAIVIEEAGLSDRARIVATDISRPALARAREGRYTTWSLRTVNEEFADRWFRREENLFVLDEKIRRRVRFTCLNLATEAFPSAEADIGEQDLIICRNVLIYFDRQTTARVAEKLFAALAPGGWLVCGSSDPMLASYAPFEVVVTRQGVFYRRRDFSDPARPAPPPHAGVTIEPSPDVVAPRPEPTRAESTPAKRVGVASSDAVAVAARLRALAASDGSAAAEREAARETARCPLDPELHYLRGMLLLDLGRTSDALTSIRRVLYLDRTLAVAHYALGAICERAGDHAGAHRAYRNAARLAAAQPAEEVAPLSDGEPHRTIAMAARAGVERLARAAGEDAR